MDALSFPMNGSSLQLTASGMLSVFNHAIFKIDPEFFFEHSY